MKEYIANFDINGLTKKVLIIAKDEAEGRAKAKVLQRAHGGFLNEFTETDVSKFHPELVREA